MTNASNIATLPTGHQYHVPSIGQRWLARIIDNAPMAVVMYVALWRDSLPALVALVILQPIYEIALIKAYGQTLGKMIMNIRVVRFDDAGELDWKQASVRWAVWQTPLWIYLFIGAIIFATGDSLLASLVLFLVVGILMHIVEIAFVAVIVTTAVNDPNRRGWHDKRARTIVIRIPGTAPSVAGQPHEASSSQQAPAASRGAAGVAHPVERDQVELAPAPESPPITERPTAPDRAPVAERPPPPAPVEAASRQIQVAMPPVDRLLVLVGAVCMVLSGLLSWLKWGPDAFPNFAGVGTGGDGSGLAVLLAGVALLVRRREIDTQIGVTLGAFVASLITATTLAGESAGIGLGAGAWVAVVGSLLALTGSVPAAADATRRPARRIEHRTMGWLGAALALLASFWMDWPASAFLRSAGGPVTGGLDSEVATGYPVLILSVAILVLLGYVSQVVPRGGANAAMHIRIAGIAVAVMAAADVAGSLMSSTWTGSGPVLALIGAVLVTRSVVPATEPATTGAGEPEPA